MEEGLERGEEKRSPLSVRCWSGGRVCSAVQTSAELCRPVRNNQKGLEKCIELGELAGVGSELARSWHRVAQS